MQLKNFLHSETSKYIFGIILGLGISSLFRKSCNGRKCLVFTSPSIKEIENQIYKYNDKCYQYNISNVSCDNLKTFIHIA